ncbi:NAD(P)H-hydrate dehydratase [Wenzhouxiangella sp. XN79A]|uniref:NAD(P)H-hydrate dehydratase n=1 Tax=Wenzhouxiangella sp. XN79A TaxID=2724193 RepID=UPI00144AE9BE|nr:NAD(P)H-hydrate dehydratase [Wenzhouxiangella sp. XN79A]NKI34663.1 NAD(P)H-hydrate dehydratase [Wenzhouxiangella sp. XN79A]
MRHAHGVYRAEQSRAIDARAIDDLGIPGIELMRRAGRAAFAVLRERFPEARRLLVVCGGGNNGGDGYVVAWEARAAGLAVELVALSDPDGLSGEAAEACAAWVRSGAAIHDDEGFEARLAEADLVVDAVLGTGLDQDVREDIAQRLDAINAGPAPVLALDVPSGLNADTGQPMGCAVRADATVTFIVMKRGLLTGTAGDWTGPVVLADLDLPDAAFDDVEADAEQLSSDCVSRWLPTRRPSTHKGDLGHLLVVGGDHGMPGAPLLAARAALETGSGLVSVATRREHARSMAVGLPEVMWQDGEDGERLAALEGRADVVALGPGLGRSDWSNAVWDRLIRGERPLVLDADGLNRLADARLERDDWILTPHPGEAARLLGVSPAEIQRDRFAAVRELAGRYRAVVVLKGFGTLVGAPDGRIAVCPFGTPAMATAGMGDALTGIVASLRGQGLAPFDAARAAVVLHARAAEAAAEGRRQVLAGRVIDHLHVVLPQ